MDETEPERGQVPKWRPDTYAKTNEEWERAGNQGKPAWCFYKNAGLNGEKYGRLYNWYAVNDPRGLAPEGYHVPSDQEWEELVEYIGGEDEGGTLLKSRSGWLENGNGTDEVKWDFRAFRAVAVTTLVFSTSLATTATGGPLRSTLRITPGAGTWATAAQAWAGSTTARTTGSVSVFSGISEQSEN